LGEEEDGGAIIITCGKESWRLALLGGGDSPSNNVNNVVKWFWAGLSFSIL
jgi:hypothetical protein